MNQTQDQPTTKSPAIKSGHRLASTGKLLTAGLGVLTVVSWLASSVWIADMIVQFKFQLAVGLLVAAAMLATTKSRTWLAICVAGLLVNSYPIATYYFGPSMANEQTQSGIAKPTDSPVLKVMTVNVLSSNQQHEKLIAWIKSEDPDFVALLEVNPKWEAVLRQAMPEFGFAHFQSRSDNFGIGLMSKYAWSQIEVLHSAPLDLPTIDVSFLPDSYGGESDSATLRIIATHPIPPMDPDRWNARNQHLRDVAGRFDQNTRNIMVGDFNLTPWSPHFDQILEIGQLADSARGFGPAPTWYVFPTWLGALKIDHILIGSGIQPLAHTIGPDVGSDHRGVALEFRVE